MSGKVKMKCPRCGKHFRSSQAKQALCADCLAKERRAKAASAAGSARPTQTAVAATPPLKIVGPGAAILVPGLVSAPAEPTASAPPPHGHSPAAPPPAHGPAHGHGADERPAKVGKNGKSATSTTTAQPKPAREPREKRPPTPPFEVSDDLRARIEARYLELAQPVEFDGIRTQIAAELAIPRSAVKHTVKDLRGRLQLASWWDLQAYAGTEENLNRIRAAYEPLLPVPSVGIHKQIAADLGLEPMLVYQGIRRIRAERRLPQYNPPELHPELPTRATETAAASPDKS